MMSMLENYEQILNKVMPLRAAHRRDLAFAVRDLSRELTSERKGMRTSYWSAPRNLSAYLRYFLPWNLYRLSWLLPTLPLHLNDGDTILDVGCGPLTLAQALWISRPELRTKKLTVICADVAPKPMEMGHSCFTQMAGKHPWKIIRSKAPLEKALKQAYGSASLVAGVNVLNELRPGKGQTMEDRAYDLAGLFRDACTKDGTLLSVEPGTRLGGKVISMLREALLDEGFYPQAPCPHDEECPMLARENNNWCHFNFPANPPLWLHKLSTQARFERKNVSLSFLFASRTQPERTEEVRVLSEPIRLPHREECARYACSDRGFTLLHKADKYYSGDLVPVSWLEEPRKDAKSGAWQVFPKDKL